MVPHSWIIECLDLLGVAENIKGLLVNSMEKWKIILCSGNSELGEVDIKQSTFQGNSLRYSAAFVSWRKSELQAINRKTRKLFTMHGALHPKSDVGRLYILRKEGGGGLRSIEG